MGDRAARRAAGRIALGVALVVGTLVVLAGQPRPAQAQTVRPVVVQYVGNKVKAKFELVNDTLLPLNVVIEPKSFDVTETGEAVYRALDASIHLKLSAMSMRIPAKQSRFVFFEATVDSLPSWFVIPCTFAGMPKHNGLDIEVELPHTVYMLQKQPIRREDVQIQTAVYSPAEKGILVELANTSAGLGRCLSAEAVSKGQRRIQASFPLLPHGARQFVIPWDAPDPPEKLILHFDGFDIERTLLEASQVAG